MTYSLATTKFVGRLSFKHSGTRACSIPGAKVHHSDERVTLSYDINYIVTYKPLALLEMRKRCLRMSVDFRAFEIFTDRRSNISSSQIVLNIIFRKGCMNTEYVTTELQY